MKIARHSQSFCLISTLIAAPLWSCAEAEPEFDETQLGVAFTEPGFYFYPPWGTMTTAPQEWAPESLPHLAVEVDQINASTGAIERHLNTLTAATPPRILPHDESQAFGVGWNSREAGLIDGTILRVTVTADGRELGRSELAPSYIPRLRTKSQMWIKFRVERGAVDRDLDGVLDWDDHCPNIADASNPLPGAEVCDGLDNDCDGAIDDGHPGEGAACNTTALGACRTGLTACGGGRLSCLQTVLPTSEVCDGIDNDCDGAIDDDGADGQLWYPDVDGDGHGAQLGAVHSCFRPNGYAADPDDCNDASASSNTPQAGLQVSAISPAIGSTAGGTEVLITGAGFVRDYRRAITVNNPGAALSDYTVTLTLDTWTPISQGKLSVNGAELRFFDSDQVTVLPHYLDSGINTPTTRISVRLPSLPSGARTLYVSYGDPNRASTSNGPGVFELMFDDFNDNAIDPALWSLTTSNERNVFASESGGELRVSGTVSAGDYSTVGYVHQPNIVLPAGEIEASVRIRVPTPAAGSNRAQFYLAGTSGRQVGIDIWAANGSSPGYQYEYYNGTTWAAGTSRAFFGDEATTFHTLRIVHNRDTDLTRFYVDSTQIGGNLTIDLGTAIDALTIGHQSVQNNGRAVDVRFDDLRIRRFASNALSVAAAGAEVATLPSVTIGGVAPLRVSMLNATTIAATVQPHAAGAADVVVINPCLAYGYSTFGAIARGFTFQAANPPSIFAISPSAGSSAGGTAVTLNGADLQRTYRRTININNGGSALVDAELSFTVDTATPIAQGRMRSDGGDLRFLNSDGVSRIPYFVASGLNTTATAIWVRIPAVPAGASSIVMTYGDATLTSRSSGREVFEVYDDFNDNVTDSGYWSIGSAGLETNMAIQETGGELRVSGRVTAGDYSSRGYSKPCCYAFNGNEIELQVSFRLPDPGRAYNRLQLYLFGWSGPAVGIDVYGTGSTPASGYNNEYFNGTTWANGSTLGLFGNEATVFHNLRILYNSATGVSRFFADNSSISTNITMDLGPAYYYFMFGHQSVTNNNDTADARFDNVRMRKVPAVVPVLTPAAELAVLPIIRVGSALATGVQVSSSGALSFIAPAGTAGTTAAVTVTNPDGQTSTFASGYRWQ